jgi:hypothetical protein
VLSRRAAGVLVAACALVGGGCGIEDPSVDRSQSDETPQASKPQEPSPQITATSSPEAVLRRAALLTRNWTSETLDRRYEKAVALSTGQAQADLSRMAAEANAGIAQVPEQVRSRATVEAVVAHGSGGRRPALVITREGITGGDLPDEGYQYKVTLAAVERDGERWVISRWSPQP